MYDVNNLYPFSKDEEMAQTFCETFFSYLREHELIEKTFTPNGEVITKVYTVDHYGEHENLRKTLKEKAIKAVQEQAMKPSVFRK